MYKYESRVKVATSATGDGWTIALGAAESGFQSFDDAGYKEGDTFPYAIEDDNGNWEVGIGAYKFNLLGLEEHSSQGFSASSYAYNNITSVSDNGKYMYIVDASASTYVRQWAMTTNYDVSTMTTLNYYNFGEAITWLAWGDDGRKVYYRSGTGFKQRTLTTAWDLGTMSTPQSYTLPTSYDDYTTYSGPFSWSDDGTKLYIYGRTEPEHPDEDKRNEYFYTIASVSTAWDLTSTVNLEADMHFGTRTTANTATDARLADVRFFNDLSVGIGTEANGKFTQFRLNKNDASELEHTGNIVDFYNKISDDLQPLRRYSATCGQPILCDNGTKLFSVYRQHYSYDTSSNYGYKLVRFDTNCQFGQTTMTRKVVASSNNNNRINLSGSAKVFVTPHQDDFKGVVLGKTTTTKSSDFVEHELDLSTGTFFKPRYTSGPFDQRITFKNVPEHGAPLVFSFVTPSANYNLKRSFDQISYANESLSVGTYAPNAKDFKFNGDGTKLYVLDGSSNAPDIVVYTMTTAYDIANASYSATYALDNTEHSSAFGLYIKPDGTKLYVGGATDKKVHEYTLSTAWDLSTLSHSNELAVINSSSYYNCTGVSVSTDGKLLFALLDGQSFYGGRITVYELETAWDISTARYNSTINAGSYYDKTYGLFMSDDLHKTYIARGGLIEMMVHQFPIDGYGFNIGNPSFSFRDEDYNPSEMGTIFGINAQSRDYFFAMSNANVIYKYNYTGSRPVRNYYCYRGLIYFDGGEYSSTPTGRNVMTFVKYPNNSDFYASNTVHNGAIDYFGPQD